MNTRLDRIKVPYSVCTAVPTYKHDASTRNTGSSVSFFKRVLAPQRSGVTSASSHLRRIPSFSPRFAFSTTSSSRARITSHPTRCTMTALTHHIAGSVVCDGEKLHTVHTPSSYASWTLFAMAVSASTYWATDTGPGRHHFLNETHADFSSSFFFRSSDKAHSDFSFSFLTKSPWLLASISRTAGLPPAISSASSGRLVASTAVSAYIGLSCCSSAGARPRITDADAISLFRNSLKSSSTQFRIP
ncbi:hypothetical protein FSOLCH5_014698 [Fusarium solani]